MLKNSVFLEWKSWPNHLTVGWTTWERAATKATDTTAPWRVPKDICTLTIFNTFLTQGEII